MSPIGVLKYEPIFHSFLASEYDSRYDLVRDFDSAVYEKRDYCYDNRGRSDGKSYKIINLEEIFPNIFF